MGISRKSDFAFGKCYQALQDGVRYTVTERALSREFGFAPTTEQVAISLGLTDAQKALVHKARHARQLRLESGGGEESSRWSPDESAADLEAPDAHLESDDERRHLMERLERLDERERAILALRFGLGGESPLTLKEVGHRLGVTREWVRKIEIRAVRKLNESSSTDHTTRSSIRRVPGKQPHRNHRIDSKQVGQHAYDVQAS
jgi:RNA polymerase sigma factor (sigma-70 family)